MQHDYLTLGGRVARETITTDGTVTAVLDFIYDSQGRPFALNYSTNGGSSFTTYYYVLNLQGDVVKLISYIPGFEYEEVASYTYDAWGNIISATGDMAELNPLRYRGYIYDTETGFYYLQSRYYDPANHRFINADALASTGQGFVGTNMFAYCNNCPVMAVDYTGKEFDFWGIFTSFFEMISMQSIMADIQRAMANYVSNMQNDVSGTPINGQSLEPYAKLRIGTNTFDNAGCGPIAVYNALTVSGVDVSISDVTFKLDASATLFNGALGTNPFSFGRLIECYGVEAAPIFSKEAMCSALEKEEVFIITYKVKGRIAIHNVAVCRTGSSYEVFNRSNQSFSSAEATSLDDIMNYGTFLMGYALN